MLGACTTCTEMSGSGVKTGMGIIHPAMLQILMGCQVARAGWGAAATGAAARGAAGLLIVAALPRATGTASWAFASPEHIRFWFFTF